MIKDENRRKKTAKLAKRTTLYLRVFPSHLIIVNNIEQHTQKPA